MSFFVVADTGIAWDLSSTAFSEIIGATLGGQLVEHVTKSCSLWEEIRSGWVNTIGPGNVTNFAWGRSSGKNCLYTEVKTWSRK
jgi:hypothetical protein